LTDSIIFWYSNGQTIFVDHSRYRRMRKYARRRA